MNLKEIVNKRLLNVVELIGHNESDIDAYLLKKIKAPKLDPIKKKNLVYPNILFPVKNVPVEWWYFTGHLQSINKKRKNKRCGFEFCIFKIHPEIIRMGIFPLYLLKKKPYLLLHSSITDKENKKFMVKVDSGLIHKDSFSYNNLSLSLNNSSLLYRKNGNFNIINNYINLELTPVKKVVKQFDEGFEITHSNPQSRAYYLSITRLRAIGKVKINNEEFKVSGYSWFDHQKCNMLIKSSLVGWDWFGITFEDNTELMFFNIRDKRGLNHKRLGGTYVDKTGNAKKLSYKDIYIRPNNSWKSPKTGTIYPSGWEIKVPKLKINAKITPDVKNQEIDSLFSSGISYWEGACNVTGTKNEKKIKGEAYAELVGYDRRLISKIVKEMEVE